MIDFEKILAKLCAAGERQFRQNTTTRASGTTFASVSTATVYLSLDAGIWVIHGYASFDSNSSGYRGLRLYNNTASSEVSSTDDVRTGLGGGGNTRLQFTKTVEIPDDGNTRTYYLQSFQSSGSTLGVTYSIEAVKIV